MAHARPFAQVDVFASDPGLGNPVAVVLDATGLHDDELARFARWTNLSETTFVLPPTPQGRAAGADYRLRIFTPGGELPFAGHPTLGSAHAWLESGGVPLDAAGDGTIVQECGAGLVTVRPTSSGLTIGESWDDAPEARSGLAFAAPPLRRSGAVGDDDLAQIAAALRIGPDRIRDAAWVDNGPGWVAVLLDSADEVLAIRPDLIAFRSHMIGVVGPHAEDSAAARSGAAIEVRAFCGPIGVTEDPVTGSLNAGIAQWLIGAGALPENYRATQGTVIGRYGLVDVTTTVARDGARQIWVGGPSTTVIRGTVTL
ncbi:PhzF family phenazine biosynthesis protein [Schumannella luteola]|uniref:PhzF family phenazine biosynthesis protein n=1 Tax=Schumannella luteola TaxID=472059 RepID=A0A852YNA4_9MICO|nr:PhzF family phenazine biosynthesis protein [Schumannella luteola]NYG99209.1 PhzF family phenazine biosynthesis protein [Schumannella luteola]TPX02519.1 PhzF family phenazine biosynthesis protein [Schumannella luteola]